MLATALDLCELTWGERDGYVCLAIRDQRLEKGDPGYWKDLTFKWPDEKRRIGIALDKAKTAEKDVYWAPAVFSAPMRSAEAVVRTDMLWADLDEADPHNFPKHLKPTAVWESSPGRYQAVWKLDREIPVRMQQKLNRQLTYAIGADRGGWDLTQVLRIPGTANHKYPDQPKVRLEYLNGRTYDPVEMQADLPETEDVAATDNDTTGITDLDPLQILRRYRIRGRARSLLRSTQARKGDRSERLWELECLLAEAGMQAKEIAAVVRASVWNKFKGRNNELKQLYAEAQKAVAHTGHPTPDDGGQLELEVVDSDDDVGPMGWREFDLDHKPIRWRVADVWAEAEVGFISGPPKSYKSWITLDLAVSVATGSRFLGTFQSRKGNVLLIQEEDPRVVLQDRLSKIGAARGMIRASVDDEDQLDLLYDLPENLYIISNQGFTITDEWLDLLEQWIKDNNICMVILDPLFMVAEGFDEFKAFEVMAALKPLKRLRARTGVSIVVVHHHTKSSDKGGAAAMYGSVALWAWEEAAMHLSVVGLGKVVAERFSKHALLSPVTIEVHDTDAGWTPTVRSGSGGGDNLVDLLSTMESGGTIDEIAQIAGLGRDAVQRHLNRLEEEGKITKEKDQSPGPGRKKLLYRLKVGE